MSAIRIAAPILVPMVLTLSLGGQISLAAETVVVQLEADQLDDKIRGGVTAQVLGNLNGLPHEFKYIEAPGELTSYTPGLPQGAFTDDDTDIEWVYLCEIARRGMIRLPPHEIADLWKRHMNRGIFCANRYARQLMDLGLQPPWTGNVVLNPWSEFNISGQFLCESFGLMAPAMPATASQLGLHYTRVAIDGEPAQATQLFTTMIALAFVETDIDRLLDAGVAAVDPDCRVAEVVGATRALCREFPADWVAARREIKRRWQNHGGGMRDVNGYELNTAATVAALIYGQKDLVETLRLAFNFGWDCDNNAATAGTIVGVIKGQRWIDAQGWTFVDVYRNTTRDNMPTDETLSAYQDRVIECAKLVIKDRGGAIRERDGRRTYEIRAENPSNVERLATAQNQSESLRDGLLPTLTSELTSPGAASARAAYVAICSGEAERLQTDAPEAWKIAIAELNQHGQLIECLSQVPTPQGDILRRRAQQAGVKLPTQ